MNKIKFKYLLLDSDIWGNSIAEICLDHPSFKDEKRCYVYELFKIDELIEKIQDAEINFSHTDTFSGYRYPFYIEISDKSFKKLKKILDTITEYEKIQENNDISLLQTIIDVYRNRVDGWSV